MKIAVVAPSRTLPRAAAEKLASLTTEGLSVEVHPQCFLEHGHFAGSDEERAAAFLDVANDPGVDAVWFARGGYGACRLLPRLQDKLLPAAGDKLFLGYSDGGFLLSALSAWGVGQPVHAPMVADSLRDGGEAAITRTLRWLSDRRTGLEKNASKTGAFAFNLAVLASLSSGPYPPSFDGQELLIEEVDEHLYAVDRMLFTVFSSGRLANIKGLRLGRVSMVPENDIDFGEDPEAIIKRWCAEYRVPYLGRADIGHDAQNAIVPFPKT